MRLIIRDLFHDVADYSCVLLFLPISNTHLPFASWILERERERKPFKFYRDDGASGLSEEQMDRSNSLRDLAPSVLINMLKPMECTRSAPAEGALRIFRRSFSPRDTRHRSLHYAWGKCNENSGIYFERAVDRNVENKSKK